MRSLSYINISNSTRIALINTRCIKSPRARIRALPKCGRNTSYILNCHLYVAKELRRMTIVEMNSIYLILFFSSSVDELISDVLLWTLTYGRAKAGRPARTYIQQLCEDTGCSPEDLPEAMNDREKWRERIRGYPCWRHDMMMMMMNSFLLTSCSFFSFLVFV